MTNKKTTGCSSCAARKQQMLKQAQTTAKNTVRTKIADYKKNVTTSK